MRRFSDLAVLCTHTISILSPACYRIFGFESVRVLSRNDGVDWLDSNHHILALLGQSNTSPAHFIVGRSQDTHIYCAQREIELL